MEASVSFVVIYNFDVIVSKLTPVQTVDLINRLWIVFDEVAAKHNVYKVEYKHQRNAGYDHFRPWSVLGHFGPISLLLFQDRGTYAY